ncbi:MAG: hypothetical protein AAGF11_18045 [Myxococcota bacterium]
MSCTLPAGITGEHVLKVTFTKNAEQGPDAGVGPDKYGGSVLGTVQLLIDDTPAEQTWSLGDGATWTAWSQDWSGAQQFITQPSKFALAGEGMNIGRDGGQPVSHDYTSPGEFDGATITEVRVTIQNNAGAVNTDKEYQAMLWRD